MKHNCARCQNCKEKCEFYDNGICRGVVFTSYPPQYKKCAFDMKDGDESRYFTDADIFAKKHLDPIEVDKIEVDKITPTGEITWVREVSSSAFDGPPPVITNTVTYTSLKGN